MSATPRPLPDTEVVEGIRRGDTGVFDGVCLKYHDALWRFAFGVLRSREGAQDVVQDVFLSLWERRAQLSVTTSLSAYLFSAVRRRALMYLRNDRTAARIAATWTPEDVPALGTGDESPLEHVERGDLEGMLARAVASLPPVRRQAIALRWGEQMGYAEIAEALDISPEAARAQVSRAYRTLRELLRAAGAEPPEW